MSWYRRSKLFFDVISRSKNTAPKQPPTRNPNPTINHNNNQYSSKFTACSNRLISIPKVSSSLSKYTSSQLRFHGTSRRFYHVVNRQRWKRWINDPDNVFFVVFVGSVVGVTILFGSYETIPYSERKHFVVITHNLERKLGEYLFEYMKRKYSEEVLRDTHPQSVRVRRITNDIIQALQRVQDNDGLKSVNSHLKGLKFEVIVVESDVVNAGCLPGGKIVVFSGLLENFETDEEVATIIGHEVAHAVARHTAEKLTISLWLVIPKIILEQYMKEHKVDTLSKYLLDLPFSRRMEIEADHIGLLLMASAGYDPRGVPKVYKKLGRMGGDSSSQDYMSTHPSGETRSKLLSNASLMQEAISLYEESIARRELDT